MKNWQFWVLFGLMIGLRFLHFGGEMDGPHIWRQSDTANYAWAFYQDGINLFRPSVCWMGGHKTLILEFPLHEALAAILYHLWGPSLIWARLISLLFFGGSAIYLFKIARLIIAPFSALLPARTQINQSLFKKAKDDSTHFAEFATLIYMILPLGLYYSRAVHIDFSAVFFCHAMLFHWMKGMRDLNLNQIVMGSIMAIFAFVTKIPYAFFLILPLAGWVWQVQRPMFRPLGSWRLWLKFFPFLLLPMVAFIAWQSYVFSINAAAPDWDFIPHYHKFTDNWGWYFGNWQQRLQPENWLLIGKRILFEVITLPGLVILALGGLFSFLKGKKSSEPIKRGEKEEVLTGEKPLSGGQKPRSPHLPLLWLTGAGIYLAIFFNLNEKHNYYQIPFMAPFALLIALAITSFSKVALRGVFIALIGIAGFWWAESNYYQKVPLFELVGEKIRQHTKPDDLIITSYGGLDCRSPHILYPAHRNGWSIEDAYVSPELVYKLQTEENAGYLAWVRSLPPSGKMTAFTAPLPADTFELEGDWKLYLYQLGTEFYERPCEATPQTERD